MPRWGQRPQIRLMPGWWSGPVSDFQKSDPDTIRDRLAFEAATRLRTNELTQLRAWDVSIAILRTALSDLPDPTDWQVILEFGIVRLGTRADAVLVCPRGILVLEFKVGAGTFDNAARRQVEDYAIDLQDFHIASRNHPIIPILVATHAANPKPSVPLLIGGASAVLDASAQTLGPLLRLLQSALPTTTRPIDPATWPHAPYRPVPGIIDAACHLFARHDVADIANARADATNLTATTSTITRLLTEARTADNKIVIFVTGVPGAGKTLCGLAITFARDDTDRSQSTAFLTGNPTLVHVLREALVRDAVGGGLRRDAAKQRMEGFIQELTRFRDDYVERRAAPPERVVVIDEAQRCWTGAQAIAKTRDRRVRLDRSEAAHLLDIMSCHTGFAAIVALVGQGQEIHDGEGGLAEWGAALRERPHWRVAAAPTTLADPSPRSRLPSLATLTVQPDLHLTVAVRSIRHQETPAWVDAVLRGDSAEARRIADPKLPFHLTRDLRQLRAGLRAATLDGQRAGLVASAGAKRLRAEGLGAERPHMEPAPVARWFLDSWLRDRDVRASDALETVATQFSIQGLELDHVGLAWDGDLIRGPRGWVVRRFAGKSWQTAARPEKIDNALNTYRVLLTRARYGTIIFVPRGDARDPTRPPSVYDAIAGFLTECGVHSLTTPEPTTLAHPPALL